MQHFHLDVYNRLGVPPHASSPSNDNAGAGSTFDAEHKYVSSPVMTPLVLAGVRLLIAGYTLVTLVVMLAWSAEVDQTIDSFFSYFTHLTYIGICAYYFAAGTQTLAYALAIRRRGSGSPSKRPIYPLQRWWRPLQALHVLLQATIVNMPIIVTAVFWAVLANSSTFATTFDAWENISVHALNAVFALFEIFLTNSPPSPWLTLASNLLVLCGYLAVAYITHATQGIYTYSFLDPAKQHALVAAYVFGIAVGEIIIFAAVRYLTVLRERWAVRTGRTSSSHRGRTRADGVDNSTTMLQMTERARSTSTTGGKDAQIEDEWEAVERPEKSHSRHSSGQSMGVETSAKGGFDVV